VKCGSVFSRATAKAGPCRQRLSNPAAPLQFAHHGEQRLVLAIECKDGPYALGFFRLHHQLGTARVDVVAQQRHAAAPLAFAACGRDLVPRPLGDNLALELRKRQ
jgi:hypothetical protein